VTGGAGTGGAGVTPFLTEDFETGTMVSLRGLGQLHLVQLQDHEPTERRHGRLIDATPTHNGSSSRFTSGSAG
jgi:hypothetical protein